MRLFMIFCGESGKKSFSQDFEIYIMTKLEGNSGIEHILKK